jgi:leucine dehydrogenase
VVHRRLRAADRRTVGSALIQRDLDSLDHETLLVRRGERSGLYTMVGIHSTVRGPSLGGCRMWSYEDTGEAVRDVLRLSRAMTLKAAAADLPLGGGKGVIALRPGTALTSARRRAALLDFAETVDQCGGRYITAEDVGTSSRDMTLIKRATPYVGGLARRQGGSGDPSPYTALGVVTAIEVTCERLLGTASLRGRTIAIIGMGHVGSRIARMCARAGAKLIAADIDPGKRDLARELGARWMTPAQALESEVDVLAPCALGGILDADTVPRLRCRTIAGAANNQLADDTVADMLEARGILWCPDFVANAGGIINICVELEGPYDPARARRRVRGIADTLRQIYDDAEHVATTPLSAAMELARKRLAHRA